jgi:stage II sporulation protein D
MSGSTTGIRSRRVAAYALLAVATACAPGEVLPPGTPPTVAGELPSAEPAVRVGITVDSATATVGATTDFEILAGTRSLARSAAARVWTFRADAQGRVQGTSDTGESTGWQDAPVRVRAGQQGFVRIGDRHYRGEVLVRATPAGRVTAINIVDLEHYLLGVVPREMGRRPATEIEALKAQAIAARTYAVGNLRGRENQGFDFYATVMDQVYGGTVDEDSITNRSVWETRGEILTHAGRPILAYYASTCGGRTAAIEESWPWRAPLPYLRSMSDRVPGTDRYYCDTSNRFTWTTRWSRDELLAVLGQTLRAHTGNSALTPRRVDNVEVVSTNASERATLRLTVDGTPHMLRADSIRWVLRPQPGPAILNSSRVTAVEADRRDGEVVGLEIRGGGWGHAIGMCQVGAMGRARAGQRYDQILQAYYSNTQIQRLY